LVPQHDPSYDPSNVPCLHLVALDKTICSKNLLLSLCFSGPVLFASRSFASDDFLVVTNNGCSITFTCTHDINNFEPETYTASQSCMLTGISSDLNIVGSGFVYWTFPDTNGKPVTL